MIDAAIIGINCDAQCHPAPPARVQARHWLAWVRGGGFVKGPGECTQTDHAECGKLATAAIVARMLGIPDYATAMQIAAVLIGTGGLPWRVLGVSDAPIADLIPDAAAALTYNCWLPTITTVDLVSCHNLSMGTVLLSRITDPTPTPAPTPTETDAMDLALVTRSDSSPDPHGPGAIYLCNVARRGANVIPWVKRHIGSPTDLEQYTNAGMAVEKVPGYLLDRAEDGAPVQSGVNPSEA